MVGAMAATHLEITVELVSGAHAHDLWPRPGRILVAARRTTFHQLADAIDDAFARWDRSHLHMFTLDDGTEISPLSWWDGEEPDGMLDGDKATLFPLRPGEQFAYVFDLGDEWAHLCTVGERRVDPLVSLGIVPDKPLPCWGWGTIPDQYGRRWIGDDGESDPPPDPHGTDLPPILYEWGRKPTRRADTEPPELQVKAVQRFCEQRVPDRARHQVRVEHHVEGNTVTIVERRAPWRPDIGPEWTSVPIAQLRYTAGMWTVYWADRDGRWLRIDDLPHAENVDPLLAAIDANHGALFWG